MDLNKRKKGVALISVLLILTFLMTMTLGFVWHTMQDYFSSISFQQAKVCYYLAQAGQDYAMFLMKHNMMIFPSFPSSRNYKDGYEANANGEGYSSAYVDQPWMGNFDVTEDYNYLYTWIGRDEVLGQTSGGMNIRTDGRDNYDDWNGVSAGADNLIDCTQFPVSLYAPPQQALPAKKYDADVYDGASDEHEAGSVINIFNSDNKEFLLISSLTLGDDNQVVRLTDSKSACGTFRIKASSSQENDQGSILVESTGMIKLVPTNKINDAPKTWDVEGSDFKILSKRTLFARIPYYSPKFLNRGYVPDSNMLNSEYIISPERWFDKFR